jgi:signal peptidase
MKSEIVFVFSLNHTFLWFIFIRDDGYIKFLTKGDNNQVDDRGLYSPGQLWLEKKDVIGRARGY